MAQVHGTGPTGARGAGDRGLADSVDPWGEPQAAGGAVSGVVTREPRESVNLETQWHHLPREPLKLKTHWHYFYPQVIHRPIGTRSHSPITCPQSTLVVICANDPGQPRH